jgi:hypothetical protein
MKWDGERWLTNSAYDGGNAMIEAMRKVKHN